MCGRTSLFVPQSFFEDRFDAEAVEPISTRYNIAPGDDLTAIPNDRQDEIDQFEWGIIPHRVDEPGNWPKPINARGETVAEKPAFRGAFEKRRCLVLADGFYEWAGSRGSKTPYRIHRPDEEPFAFAGLWESWSDNSNELETVTIITTEANDMVAPIQDRMPVMLEPDEEERWLDEDDPDELQALLDPYPDDQTEAYEIATTVNDPANDSPEVIEPIGHGQSGLGQFG